MNSDNPDFAAAREEAKRQLRADGIDPDLPGWRGLVEIKAETLITAAQRGMASADAVTPMTAERFLARYEVRCFYHFTDTRNLDSIRKAKGLLSSAELNRRKIQVPAPGGNDWSHEADERVGVDEYVHLCLFSEHPMEYRAKQEGRILESRFLEINFNVLTFDGIRFTPDVSNKRGVELLTLSEACSTLDFEVIYDRTDWRDPEIKQRRLAAKKYELLIPKCVPLELISGV